MRSKFLFSIILPGTFVFFLQGLHAQSDSAAKKSYFKAGMDYLSNAVYSGRKDSSVVSYLKPSIGYVNRSGFSLGAEMSILANSPAAGRVDEIALEPGYNYSKGNFDAGAYASKYFYSNGSYAVLSELEATVGTYFEYNLGFLKLGAGGDFLFSTSTDISLSFNMAHSFELGPEGKKWRIGFKF